MPETIIQNGVNDQFIADYTRYAIYTMYRRVLPDFRDGFTPVKRRIMYAMYADTKAIKHNVKCAAIVGDVMKNYHPHGDASIYETLVPLANWFETNIPLVDPQGNFGNFLGDPAAHQRYTEAKMSKFGLECVIGELQDTKNAVDWSPNYSQTVLEPDYLPVKVPLLLINGTFGICPGLRCEIPSHNMNEVIDATIALICNPNIDIVLAPDHNMKCEIFNTDFAQISRVGFGHYTVRGIIKEEIFDKKQALVITSLPNLTFMESIKNRIDELIMNKVLVQIDKYFDESTDDKMRFIIVLKNGADPNYVKEVLYKNTKLEQTCRVNFECLNGLHPYRMSYKAYLQSFIDSRIAIKYRYYANRLQDLQTRIHEREAYIKILESGEVDDVINRIRKQKSKVDDTELVDYLMKRFNVTDLQAKYIININLKYLSPAYLQKFKEEAEEARVLIDKMKIIPIDDSYIRDEIINELLDIKKKYGRPRNCPIVNKASVSGIPSGMMTIAITDNNFVKKVPMGANIGTAKSGFKCIINIDNIDSLLIFDIMGRVFKIPVASIPFTDKASNGMDIRFLCKTLTADICTIMPESYIRAFIDADRDNVKSKHFMISLSKSGLIKRMSLDDFAGVPKSGILYAKVDPDDSIKEVLVAHSGLDIIVFSDKKASRMNVLDVPYLKRNTKGSRAMSSSYPIDGMVIINTDGTHVVVVTENGYLNKIDINALPSSMKGKAGFPVIKLNTGDKIKSIFVVNDNYILNAKTIAGKGVPEVIPVDMIPISSSISKGTRWISTRGNKIMHCYLTLK